jgi:outer membrane biosynthesis protein TonB
MRRNKEKLMSILGAIIVHLIAGIIFMVVKIGTLNINKYTKQYEIALEDISLPEKKEIRSEETNPSIEKILQGDQDMMNIARNLANQPDVKINAEDYIDKVKEELIKSGQLTKDNYIDEQKKLKDMSSQTSVSLEDKNNLDKEVEKPKDSQQMAANYSGPTRIYYNLPGRTNTYLSIPIYKCEGSGKAVLSIDVNPKGEVTSAKIIESESTTSDPCLIEAAINSALISRFSPDINAQKIQTGSLTYLFVAQ